uniref:Uncharacterized protein n=1 Tax=Schistosoma mansoni TaxID=6183 RepID=A0A5K4F818_SCHMA
MISKDTYFTLYIKNNFYFFYNIICALEICS